MDAPNPMQEYLLQEGRLQKWLLNFMDSVEKIRGFPNVRNRLDELQEAGADPEMLLIGLVMIFPGAVPTTKRQSRERTKQLTSLANRLERMAQEVERTISDPMMHSAFWRVFLLEKGADFTQTAKRCAGGQKLCNGFKVFVNFFRAEAKEFQELARAYEAASTSEGIAPVLRYVKQATGKFHDECVADLLQAAYDASGVEASFSAEMLRKFRQRKVPDVIHKRKRSNPLELLYGMTLGGLDK